MLKTEGEARGFQPSRGTLQMLMNYKIMFDRYYCLNSTKHCENEENEENIGALYGRRIHMSPKMTVILIHHPQGLEDLALVICGR